MRKFRRLIPTPDFAGAARRYCVGDGVTSEALEGGSQNEILFLRSAA